MKHRAMDGPYVSISHPLRIFFAKKKFVLHNPQQQQWDDNTLYLKYDTYSNSTYVLNNMVYAVLQWNRFLYFPRMVPYIVTTG